MGGHSELGDWHERAAVVQLCPSASDLPGNLRRAAALIDQAAAAGATLVGLPEIFTVEYQKDLFASAAEPIAQRAGGDSAAASSCSTASTGSALLAAKAREHAITVFGGVVERAGGGGAQLFNSVAAYGPDGELLTVYRKIHLSCVRVGPDWTSEADVFSPGAAPARFPAVSGAATAVGRPRVGLGICFDLRFDLHRAYTRAAPGVVAASCDVLAYPSAFLESSGKDHWELLLRARALDEQVFVMAPNHGRREGQATAMFGHAAICGPWGEVLATTAAADGDALAVADLRAAALADVRIRIPLLAVRTAVALAAPKAAPTESAQEARGVTAAAEAASATAAAAPAAASVGEPPAAGASEPSWYHADQSQWLGRVAEATVTAEASWPEARGEDGPPALAQAEPLDDNSAQERYKHKFISMLREQLSSLKGHEDQRKKWIQVKDMLKEKQGQLLKQAGMDLADIQDLVKNLELEFQLAIRSEARAERPAAAADDGRPGARSPAQSARSRSRSSMDSPQLKASMPEARGEDGPPALAQPEVMDESSPKERYKKKTAFIGKLRGQLAALTDHEDRRKKWIQVKDMLKEKQAHLLTRAGMDPADIQDLIKNFELEFQLQARSEARAERPAAAADADGRPGARSPAKSARSRSRSSLDSPGGGGRAGGGGP